MRPYHHWDFHPLSPLLHRRGRSCLTWWSVLHDILLRRRTLFAMIIHIPTKHLHNFTCKARNIYITRPPVGVQCPQNSEKPVWRRCRVFCSPISWTLACRRLLGTSEPQGRARWHVENSSHARMGISGNISRANNFQQKVLQLFHNYRISLIYRRPTYK